MLVVFDKFVSKYDQHFAGRKCRVYLDPHIQTSDGYHYSNLQDACNYSLIQRGGSYHPDVAIFADFG